MTDLRVEILETPDDVATRGAEILLATAVAAVAASGECRLALSGGSTPWRMLDALASEPMPWAETSIYQVDERVAPDGDASRNLTQLLAVLGDAGKAASIHAMDVTADDLDLAATSYAAALPDSFDLVHLGLGADGHTASLVPADAVLDVRDRLVAATAEYKGQRRLTLTYPALERARLVLWLVTGEDKREAVERLVARDPAIPAGRVEAPRQLLLADEAAAAGLTQGLSR
ncbi:MAG: 6-phosphogluconolactonase [Gaiella sp.]